MWWRKKEPRWQLGMKQAIGVVAYISLIATIFANGERWFGRMPNYLGPVLFLSLFVVSALTCSLIVFYEPYQLFTAKKGREALETVVGTTKWLAVFVVGIVTVLAVFLS